MNTSTLLEQPKIRQFSRAIQPFALAYRHCTFTFVVLSLDGHDTIIRGRLLLASAPGRRIRTHFRTQTVCAAEVALPESVDVDHFVSAMATGAPFSAGGLTLRLPTGEASVWVLRQLLGFETIHFGKVEEYRDASDIFAVTPQRRATSC